MTTTRWTLLALLMATANGALAASNAPTVHLATAPTRTSASRGTFPRVIVGGAVSAPVAARINAALARDEAAVARAARECLAEKRRERPELGSVDSWEREVTVTMQGPRFLAYNASDSYQCAGPYPSDGRQLSLVYDLTKGRPVDWLTLFPPGAKGARAIAADGSPVGLVVWEELTRRAAAEAEPECRDSFAKPGHAYSISLAVDADGGALVAWPADLPHVVQACAQFVVLPTATLKQLGFAPALVAALEVAPRP